MEVIDVATLLRVGSWCFAFGLLAVGESVESWVNNPWLQLGAVGILGVCFLFLLWDNRSARKDWLAQVASFEIALRSVVAHCAARGGPAVGERSEPVAGVAEGEP